MEEKNQQPNRFLISHEVPISLLEQSKSFNDYDYCLVHLLEEEPQYKEFYFNSVREGRRVLLDNSLFELGEAFEASKFAEHIQRLHPTEFVVPDVMNNWFKTLIQLESWFKKYPKEKLPGNRIAVLQGHSLQSILDIYTKYLEYGEEIDKIAVSFDYQYFQKDRGHPNRWVNCLLGRVEILKEIYHIRKDYPNSPKLHLLGCANPLEFGFYKDFDFIESLDTSSPVVHTIQRIPYSAFGVWNKESIKLVDLLQTKFEDIDQTLLQKNLDQFRKIVNH